MSNEELECLYLMLFFEGVCTYLRKLISAWCRDYLMPALAKLTFFFSQTGGLCHNRIMPDPLLGQEAFELEPLFIFIEAGGSGVVLYDLAPGIVQSRCQLGLKK